MKTKLRLVDYSILITTASTSLYIVFRNLGREIGSFAFLWAPITLLLIIVTPHNYFKKIRTRYLFLYGIIVVGFLQYTLWYNMTDWNRIRILYEFYYLVIMITILNYYLGRGELNKLAWLSKWIFFFIIITLVTTNIALFLDPYVVRASADTSNFTQHRLMIYKYFGAMSYSYIQSIICLIPILIYYIKNKKQIMFSPKLLTVILVLIIITEMRSQVFGNIIITALITVLSLLGFATYRKSFIVILLMGTLFLFIPIDYYVKTFQYFGTFFQQDSDMYNKLNDFALFIEYSEISSNTDAGSRALRYPILIDALLQNPFLGYASFYNSYEIMPGAHLYLMNRLALWGIFGFSLFITVHFYLYRLISYIFESNYRHYYFLSVLTLVLLGLIKAVGGRELWLMLIVVIPGLYFLPLLHQNK